MSAEAGGDGAANIFISTNAESFREFIKAAVEGFQEVEKKGKKTFKSLSQEMTDFIKVSLGGALVSAGKDFAETVAEPFNTTFKSATDDAREFRRENSRLAVAVGQDWRQLGSELDALSVKTRRPQEQLRSYAEQVNAVTGNWASAKEGVETYSKLATYLGKKSVEELAPLAAEMENTFGIKGKTQSEEFFNSLISKAEALGQKGQLAVALWQKIGPTMGRESAKGAEGGRQAKQDAQMMNAMLSMGATPEEAQKMMGKTASLFSGDLQWMERHMKAWGVIDPRTGKAMGKGAHLRGKFGRLNYSHLELLQMLRQTESKRTGGSQARLHQRLRQDQNLGEDLGDLVANNWEEFQAHVDAQNPAGGGKPLDDAKRLADDTPEGRRQAEELLRKLRDRQQVGDPTLKAQDAASRNAPGGSTGLVQNYGIKGVGIAAAMKTAEVALGRLGLGRVAGVVGKANPLLQLAAITTMSGDSATPAPTGLADYYGRMSPAQRSSTLTAELEGMRKSGGRGAYGGYEEVIQAANPQLAKEQAKEFANKLKEGAPVPVVVRVLGMGAPLPGMGEQVH